MRSISKSAHEQPRVIFYTTLGCHLCEEAEIILRRVLSWHGSQNSVQLQAVDIADDLELMERYGLRIPVVKFSDNPQELGWPFDDMALEAFIRQGVNN